MTKKLSGSAGKATGNKPKKFRKRQPQRLASTPAASAAAESRPTLVRPERVPLRARTAPSVPVIDYHYVLADLKRIGLTSAVIVAVLVALSFVLR